METYFHFTTLGAWLAIQREGIIPQPIKSFHPDMHSMCDDLGITDHVGSYIWPEVTRSLLRDFFLFKQTHDRTVEGGLLLAVEVNIAYMLGKRWLAWENQRSGEDNTLKQTHDLTFTLSDGTKRQDHVAHMELYLEVIPPIDIEPIARIYQTIEPILDKSTLAVDLGLTP